MVLFALPVWAGNFKFPPEWRGGKRDMDTNKLIKEPFYYFPELLPYLRNDLLPGIKELLAYANQLRSNPDNIYGLTSRVEALRDDLTNALAGVNAGQTYV
jgi:hypothetical protein